MDSTLEWYMRWNEYMTHGRYDMEKYQRIDPKTICWQFSDDFLSVSIIAKMPEFWIEFRWNKFVN